jgi:hypothetical protein
VCVCVCVFVYESLELFVGSTDIRCTALLSAVYYLSCPVCCGVLSAVCYLLSAVCCLLSAACCLLSTVTPSSSS